MTFGKFSFTPDEVLYAHDSWQEHPSRARGYDFVRLSTADANEKSRHPGTHVYTDGYFTSWSAGAAVVVLRPNDSMVAVLKYRLNAASSAYCAEVVAFKEALRFIQQHECVPPVHIYSDSLSLLTALAE